MFGHGGLQRDCIAIARRLIAKGHDVQIVCASAEAPPADLDIVVLPVRAFTNHGRNAAFSRRLAQHVAERFDVVAGFDALEGLDVLYCANPPVRLYGLIDKLNPRKRGFLALERACFGPQSRTRLMLLSGAQHTAYDARWHLAPERVSLVPPTIERSRVVAAADRAPLRAATRAALGLAPDQETWLFVGSYPQTKGLDRLIGALAHFQHAHVLCVGPKPEDTGPFRTQASRLGVERQISWLGARDDIPALMVAADLLVHPSRLDITGTVILEAIANGLPVIATSVCGYAPHIAAAEAGRVLGEPFSDSTLVETLREAEGPALETWRANAARYAEGTNLFSGLDVAAGIIGSRPA